MSVSSKNDVQKKPWEKVTIDSDLWGIAYSAYEHGTPEWKEEYLTKEQIEAEGWVHVGGQMVSHGRQNYEKGEYVLNHWGYSPPRELSLIRIYTKEDSMPMGNYNGIDKILYDGSCPSVNELRYISKLLGIK